MATLYTSDYLSRLRRGVERFEEAFDRWMQTQVENTLLVGAGLLPTVSPKPDVDKADSERLALDVAEAAGVAARAVQVTGTYMLVQGIAAPMDAITNWHSMTLPKAWLTPEEVRVVCATVRGRLETLDLDAQEAEGSQEQGAPAFGPFAFHRVIWTAAAPHWTNHQYRSAVREGGEALNRYWKEVLGRTGVQDTQFWGETLSTEPRAGRPRLRWQDTGNERTDRGIREGLPQLAKGLNLMIRNVTTHGGTELSEQEAMEQLGAYSYLARMLDRCVVEGRSELEV